MHSIPPTTLIPIIVFSLTVIEIESVHNSGIKTQLYPLQFPHRAGGSKYAKDSKNVSWLPPSQINTPFYSISLKISAEQLSCTHPSFLMLPAMPLFWAAQLSCSNIAVRCPAEKMHAHLRSLFQCLYTLPFLKYNLWSPLDITWLIIWVLKLSET